MFNPGYPVAKPHSPRELRLWIDTLDIAPSFPLATTQVRKVRLWNWSWVGVFEWTGVTPWQPPMSK